MLKKVLIPLVVSFNLFAAEADHFSMRDQPLNDIVSSLNKDGNEFIAKAVMDANKKGSCNEEALYAELKKYFGNHSTGKLVKDLLHDDNVSKRVIPIKQSVYQKWSIWNGYLLGRKSAETSPLALSPMIKVNGVVIGIDKLEHMFGMGNIYFNNHYLKGKSLRKVLKNGIFREKTALGGNILATGVFAYGDLAANFNGMRFWNHFLQKQSDVLGAEYDFGPYVECVGDSFQVNQDKPLKFENYVDYSMDESVNCSKFATKSGARKYLSIMNEKSNDACNMASSKYLSIKDKYDVETPGDSKHRPISHWIINDDGVEDVSYLNEF